ncbi:MAG: TetR/AcrR family transcriptional regulator [Moraxella sp.]|nr:TetR/AcrR family transcriptional regulator [Moraxella sp.]
MNNSQSDHQVKVSTPDRQYKRSALMQERIEQTKRAILTATKQLISDGGFKNAQIAQIAEMAGVSNGLVYRHFDNKSELMKAVLGDVAGMEIAILQSIASSGLSARDKLHRAVKTFVKRALNDPHMANALMLEPVDDAAFEMARFGVKADIATAITTILQEGQTAGVWQVADTRIAALCIVGAMTYAVIEPLNIKAQDVFDDAYRAYFSQNVADFCVNSCMNAT